MLRYVNRVRLVPVRLAVDEVGAVVQWKLRKCRVSRLNKMCFMKAAKELCLDTVQGYGVWKARHGVLLWISVLGATGPCVRNHARSGHVGLQLTTRGKDS